MLLKVVVVVEVDARCSRIPIKNKTPIYFKSTVDGCSQEHTYTVTADVAILDRTVLGEFNLHQIVIIPAAGGLRLPLRLRLIHQLAQERPGRIRPRIGRRRRTSAQNGNAERLLALLVLLSSASSSAGRGIRIE